MGKTLGLTTLLIFSWVGAVFAQTGAVLENTLTVHGHGTIIATPDTATIRAGVVTQSFTAAQGLAENAKVMNRVVNGLRRHGIQKKDIQTHNFSVTPQYARQAQNSSLVQRIAGYRVSNDITVNTSDVFGAGRIVDALVQEGINRIDGIRFSLRDPEQVADAARRKAVDEAHRKAELFAKQAGVTLGRAIRISDSESAWVPRMAGDMATRITASVPVEPGNLEITARVRVTYAIK